MRTNVYPDGENQSRVVTARELSAHSSSVTNMLVMVNCTGGPFNEKQPSPWVLGFNSFLL